jgi:hypothetical protein
MHELGTLQSHTCSPYVKRSINMAKIFKDVEVNWVSGISQHRIYVQESIDSRNSAFRNVYHT